MRYEAAEQLSKILAPSHSEKAPSPRRRKRSRDAIEFEPSLAEGWFLLALLVAVVYSTVWCVQLAITSPSMGFLTYVSAFGLALGVYGARQTRFASWLMHIFAVGGAVFIAYTLTSGSNSGDTSTPLFQRILGWFGLLVSGGVSSDDSIFVFFIATLGFLLAYTSAWLIYRARSPWLVIGANAAVLLISMNNSSPALVIFLIAFVLASLLLLLRFNLAEWTAHWQGLGLRYADDLSWDVMQAGCLISVGIIILSWVLPGSYTSSALSLVWNANDGPVSQITNTWNRLFSVSGSSSITSRGNFRENPVLGGNPNLSDEVVFTVKTTEQTPPYLSFVSYDNYTGGQWSISNAEITQNTIKANTPIPAPAAMTREITETITVKNPPGEQHPYIAGPFEVTQVNLSARLLTDQNGAIIAWLSGNGSLPAGATYTIKAGVSAADPQTLKQVSLPADAPVYHFDPRIPESVPSVLSYEPSVLSLYTQLPKNLDPRIKQKAEELTKSAPTMYEKMQALERFLRTYTYSLDVHPPAGKDPVSWFLFDGKKGFCNYYASSMVLMARSLGIPARIVAGYRYGEAKDGADVIKGKDAHSWPQVYFAGYGWINFEPTGAFPELTRPQPNQYPGASTDSGKNSGTSTIPLPRKPFNGDENADSGSNNSPQKTNAQNTLNQALMALGGTFVLLLLFSALALGLWWRRLFRRYSLVTQIFGRVYTLANLAGVKWSPSQTPYEYLQALSTSALSNKDDAIALEKLGDIYVRERWADPASREHSLQSDETVDLPGIWRRVRPHLLRYTVKHPHFLRWLPLLVWRQLVQLWKSIRTRRPLEDEVYH